MINPVIKWTGSKRHSIDFILPKFPKKIDTYYEPFVGGGSIFRALIESDIQYKNIICSDINKDLINLWNQIKNDWAVIANDYSIMWDELNADNNIDVRRDYYNSVRTRYNAKRKPSDFLFLSRTAINGLIRYNKSGQFNSAFHFTRKGIVPESMAKILEDWSNSIKDVEFRIANYLDIYPNSGDFMYLDPPYYRTKDIYYGGIDYLDFCDWLRKQKCGYLLSFDGTVNGVELLKIPNDLYDYIFKSKNTVGGFRKVMNTNTSSSDFLYYRSCRTC